MKPINLNRKLINAFSEQLDTYLADDMEFDAFHQSYFAIFETSVIKMQENLFLMLDKQLRNDVQCKQ